MKPTKIEFSFDDAKLEAIKLFLKEKDVSLDEELDHCMDALYKKYVPQPVRDFIEKKEAEAAQAAAPAKKNGRKKKSDAGAPASEASENGTAPHPGEESPM